MQQSLQAMQTALRILTTLTEKRRPDSRDVSELERLLGPRPNGIDLDEWACDAIMQAMKRMAAIREASAGE